MIYYTIYSSNPKQPVSKEILAQIGKKSNSNNAKLDISGILLGIENKYFQYLEGPEEAVNDLMKEIKTDARHSEVVTWMTGYTKERIFSEWSMATWMLTQEELTSLTALDDLRMFLRDPSNSDIQSKRFIIMMNGILKTWIEKKGE